MSQVPHDTAARVWLGQCLCPQRHCILAAAGLATDDGQAAVMITAPLRAQVQTWLEDGTLNPWCGLCKAAADSWHYEVGRTSFATLAEAAPKLHEVEVEMALTNILFGDRSAGEALVIGEAERQALANLRLRAAEHPLDVAVLRRRPATPEAKCLVMAQLHEQTVEIPIGYMVTFTIETGHPAGAVRHLTIASLRSGRLPAAPMVWIVAEELGFIGSLEQCDVWHDKIEGSAGDVNVVQPIAMAPEGQA